MVIVFDDDHLGGGFQSHLDIYVSTIGPVAPDLEETASGTLWRT